MDDSAQHNPPSYSAWASRLEPYAVWFFFAAFALFLILYAARPIHDPDFWWHLKSGEVMAQNGGLLSTDPFTFSGDGVVSAREALILKGYWLWELTAYALYDLFGFNGIHLLSLLTIGAMAGVVTWQLRRQQVGYALAALLLAPAFFLLSKTYALERPQVISFLLAALLVALLNRVRDGGQPGWTLPLLMLLWANLHGGFVVGDLILLCFAAGAVLEYHHDLPRMRPLLGWVALGIGASLLNPNGALVFPELFNFHNSRMMTGVGEYQSTWVNFQGGNWSVAILWLLIALYSIGLWRSRRLYWPEFFVALLLACLSVLYKRNVGFFTLAMLPAIGYSLQQGGLLPCKRIAAPWKYLILLSSAALLLWQASVLWQRGNKADFIRSLYPEAAARFILDSGIQGRMFNDYDFGGYLLWKLYPQHRVFIDGRGLDADLSKDWSSIMYVSYQEVGGRKEFEVLLDRYGIDYVVLPIVHFQTGRLTPLLKFLSIKPEWIPVYVDRQSYILVRNSPTNAAMIARYRLDKDIFFNTVIGYLAAYSKSSPASVGSHVGLAEMLIFVGRFAEAEEQLAVIARLQPGNPDLPVLRNMLAALRRGTKP